MAFGSPMLRGLATEVAKHIQSNAPGKILITEDTPLLAWWWELFLRLALFDTTTFHSSLSAADRFAMIKLFNEHGTALKAMVLPYDVGALGINLQHDCSKVVVMSPAKSTSAELQAMFRPMRVSGAYEKAFSLIASDICSR
jgi:hypothetical protein